MNDWISINNRLPEIENRIASVDCLITNGDWVSYGYKYYGECDNNENDWKDVLANRNVHDVTHWMYLPKAPNER